MRQRRPFLPVLIVIVASLLSASYVPNRRGAPSAEQRWVDSVYNAMTESERLGQLFMIRAHSDKGQEHINEVMAQIERYHVGGLCFFQGTPEKQVELVNQYQQLASPVPMLIAIDGEWGLGMRMKSSTISFPKQLMLGAMQDNRLLYDMGKEVARQMRLVGVNINFAPVADVNNNPANPVINTRSFGEGRYNVAVKSYMYAKGMEDNGILACAKHFPGHGDTDVDSHLDLPVIPHSRQRLDSIELFPFRLLSQYGIGSMMVAHLDVPALDSRKNRPTTLSYSTVTDLLKKEIGFEGLIFTDALEMKGVTKHFRSGQVEAEALLAGNDILLLPESLEASVAEIRKYIAEGKISWDRIGYSVKKILRAKYRLGLAHFTPLPVDSLRKELNAPSAVALKRELIANALTLVRNRDGLVPFRALDSLKLASLSIGAARRTPFQERLLSYRQMPVLQVGRDISAAKGQELAQKLKGYDAVVVGLHDMSGKASDNWGVNPGMLSFLRTLSRETRVILVVFGNPYSLRNFDDMEWVLEAYDEDPITQDLAAQALFGAIALKGRLPVTASPRSSFEKGVYTSRVARFGYAPPASAGLDSTTLARIDEIAGNAIEAKATPGCVVLVAKEGQVVFEKAYGYHTYRQLQPVRTDDLFDLASLTKVTATTLAVMKLYEQGKLSLDTPIVRYLPELQGTNKANLILRDIMAHRAGLEGWIPFYKQTMTTRRRKVRQRPEYYRQSETPGYTVPVANHLFLRDDFQDRIWQEIYDSKVSSSRKYEYSDLGFYLIARMVQRLSGQPLDEYLALNFYQPMGLKTATYNPLKSFPLERVVPTERDNYFRLQTVHGYVHDMGAAMLGGVSGHAGLFATAHDVGVIMQMLLNGGTYGGQEFLRPATIAEFTTRHPLEGRRGLGFDMRQLDAGKWLNLPAAASEHTFGHTGFTGTCAWADPDKQLVYVFLSNRTYPSMHNYKLNKLKTRRRILSTIYEAMDNFPGFGEEAQQDGLVMR
ncbi:MAG: serine hydrolase [Phaeodactylibacter sp.]|nr:serine hydrolase [Phaeodactylibacter sp.]